MSDNHNNFGSEKVTWSESGPHVGENPISREQASDWQQGPALFGEGDVKAYKEEQEASKAESAKKVGPVVAFVAAAAVGIWGINALLNNDSPSRPAANNSGAAYGPAFEPAGQRAPLKAYVKPDGAPIRLWADFQKTQLRVTIPEGACIEMLDKDHAFGMSSVTIQYSGGRYEHGLIDQSAKVKPAPECNNTMR